jgi:hypothetical protein
MYDALGMLADMPGLGHHHDELPDPALRVWSVKIVSYHL